MDSSHNYPTYDVSQFENKEEKKLPPPVAPSSSALPTNESKTRTENIKDMKYEIRMETILGQMMKHFHMAAWMFPSKNATPLQRQQITEYYKNFGAILPCPKCRHHYENYIKDHPIDTHNLFEWTIDLHNDINRIEGKPIVSKDEALIGLVRSVAYNTAEIDAKLEEEKNNITEEEGGEVTEASDSSEVSTTTSIVLLSITFVGLSLLLFLAWKNQNDGKKENEE